MNRDTQITETFQTIKFAITIEAAKYMGEILSDLASNQTGDEQAKTLATFNDIIQRQLHARAAQTKYDPTAPVSVMFELDTGYATYILACLEQYELADNKDVQDAAYVINERLQSLGLGGSPFNRLTPEEQSKVVNYLIEGATIKDIAKELAQEYNHDEILRIQKVIETQHDELDPDNGSMYELVKEVLNPILEGKVDDHMVEAFNSPETREVCNYQVQCANAFKAKSDAEILEDVQRGLDAVYDGHNLPDAIIDGQMYDMKTTGQCLTGSEGTNAIIDDAVMTPAGKAILEIYDQFAADRLAALQAAYPDDTGSRCDSCGSYISECVCNWDAADESESLMHQEVNEGVMDEDAIYDMMNQRAVEEDWDDDLDEDGDPKDPEKGLENKIPVGYKES